MARPRKDSAEADARTRIVDAFWQLLASGRHISRVSAGAVAALAGCNRGTFYYYFKSMDALVEEALRELLTDDGQVVDALFRVMVTGDLRVFEGVNLAASLHRIVVGIGSGVDYKINAAVRSAIMQRWEAALYASERELSSDACFMVQFELSGVMSYLLAMALSREEGGAEVMRPRPPADLAHGYMEATAERTLTAVAEAEGLDAEAAAAKVLASLERPA